MKLVKSFLVASGLVIVFSFNTYCQNNSGDSLYIVADYSTFRLEGDTANSYVEIFYNLFRSSLKHEPATSGYAAMISMKMILSDTNRVLIDSTSWTAASRIESLSSLQDSTYLISDIIGEKLPVGSYILDVFASNSGRIGHCSFMMNVPSYKSGELAISSIEFAYEITPDSSGKFLKAGYRVMPNPSRSYYLDKRAIYLYAEAYNLKPSIGNDMSYSITLDILGLDGLTVKSIPAVSYKKPGESAVLMTGFSIATLKPGQYDLRLTLADGEYSTAAFQDFKVLATKEQLKTAQKTNVYKDFLEANEIRKEEDAKKFRNEIIYIASGSELKLYDSLNLTGKSNFQKEFWIKRNPDPNSPVNSYELEHYRRFQYANTVYGKYGGASNGWKTDRGRVYILFGEPSNIERYPSSLDSRAWERWWFDSIEGGIYFIFVDFEIGSDYTLVHSSKQGEMKDLNWEDKIKMTLFQR